MTSSIERLRELLEEPLLVTNLVNVLYLTGFDSSNAALLVEPDRARLFTDFRYIEAARAVEGVEAVQTKRALIGWLGENLSGRIGFEANVLPWSFAEQSARRPGSSSCRGQGARRAAARGQGRGRARDAPARLCDHRPDVRAARDRGAVRRPPRARRRLGHHAALPRGRRRTSLRSSRSSAPARPAPGRTRGPATASSRRASSS